MPANVTSTRRAVASIAALTAALVASGSLHGPHVSFALSLPLLVFAAGSLASAAEVKIGPEMARTILACGLAVPAVNVWYAALLTRMDALIYYLPERGLLESLAGAAFVARSSGPLLWGAAAGFGVLLGRRGIPEALILLGGALGARTGRLLLQFAAQSLNAGDAVFAAHLCLVAAVSGALFILPPLVWAVRRTASRPARLMILMLALLSAVAGSPPVLRLVRSLPAPSGGPDVPKGPPGLSWSIAPLDLRAEDVQEKLVRRRYFPIRDPEWACSPALEVRWWEKLRATVATALPADAPATLLVASLPMLASYGVDRLVLVGRSTPIAPPLDDWMGWPGAPLLLDRPPSARWLSIGSEGWTWLAPEKDEPLCIALAEESATVGDLYRAVRALVQPGQACAHGMALAPYGSPDQLPALGCL